MCRFGSCLKAESNVTSNITVKVCSLLIDKVMHGAYVGAHTLPGEL